MISVGGRRGTADCHALFILTNLIRQSTFRLGGNHASGQLQPPSSSSCLVFALAQRREDEATRKFGLGSVVDREPSSTGLGQHGKGPTDNTLDNQGEGKELGLNCLSFSCYTGPEYLQYAR